MPTTRRTPINPNTAAAELTRRIIKADPAACFSRRGGTYDLIIDSCDCGCDRVGIRVKARKGGRVTFAQDVALGYALELGRTGGYTTNGAYIDL